jgi:hypothetical protein
MGSTVVILQLQLSCTAMFPAHLDVCHHPDALPEPVRGTAATIHLTNKDAALMHRNLMLC